MFHIKYLEWDSNFFGLSIYDLEANNICKKDILNLKKEINSINFDVIQTKIN